MENNEIADELLRSVWTDNRIDNDQYVIHKSRVESIVKQLQNTSSNSDYAKCKDCGAPMNEGEAKTFTVCDDFWEKHFFRNH